MKARIVGTVAAFFLVVVIAEGAAAGKIVSDYDPNANFSQYRTFMWITKPHMPDPFMDDRIVNAINGELTAKGWKLVTEGADVSIAAHVASKKAHTLETFYNGFGGGWGWHYWGGGVGLATTHAETYTVGTLVVDLFDTRTRKLIWRGWATDALPDNPQKETKKLDKDIQKLFKNLPPK
jgi:hypothetical protein